MRLADVRVSELLAHVRDVFSIRAEEDGIILDIAEPEEASVVADFDRIEQVLGNLLDNAFRHTPTAGRIEAGGRRAAAGFVEFYVSDSGSSIRPEELPHVFDRFYRSSGEPSGIGAGLGLTISREIVRAHGGEIHAEANATGGTTFAFTLPLSGGGKPSAVAGERDQRRWRISPPGEMRRADS